MFNKKVLISDLCDKLTYLDKAEVAKIHKAYLLAAAEVSATHREIGKLAIHAYVNGGGLSDLESILSSSGPQEIMDKLSTLENLGVGKRRMQIFRISDFSWFLPWPVAAPSVSAPVRDLCNQPRLIPGLCEA